MPNKWLFEFWKIIPEKLILAFEEDENQTMTTRPDPVLNLSFSLFFLFFSFSMRPFLLFLIMGLGLIGLWFMSVLWTARSIPESSTNILPPPVASSSSSSSSSPSSSSSSSSPSQLSTLVPEVHPEISFFKFFPDLILYPFGQVKSLIRIRRLNLLH